MIAGWTLSLLGTIVWIYGYFVPGHPPLIDWSQAAPWWIADFLPNMEAELGAALMILALAPMYLASRRERASVADQGAGPDA